MASNLRKLLQMIDIGANLTDPMFRGMYHGSQKHADDFQDVLRRAWDVGIEKIIVTGGSLEDSQKALDLARTNDRLYATVGCHPTRCEEFEANNAERYLSQLISLIKDNKDKVVAVGEFGLDYDRINFCRKDVQLKYFDQQFAIAEETRLPLFLHCRSASKDLLSVLNKNRDKFTTGVVHSFTGTMEDVSAILDFDLYIGINGCSLKTQDNVDAMCTIPAERLMIETDAPWCEIKDTHASRQHVTTTFPARKKEKWEQGCMVKGRNEPACILQVLEAIAAARDEDITELANTIYHNTMKVFFPTH